MRNADVAIIGGGLAGLTAAIHLAYSGLSVILIEKKEFPFHKVCGEYLSREILPYLNALDLDIFSLKPKQIQRLKFSTSNGNTVSSKLKMGGFGVSRYTLDNYLYEKAVERGTKVIQDTVTGVEYYNDNFIVECSEGVEVKARFVLGAYGKRSLMDKKLTRSFIQKKSGWLAVKAHYRCSEFDDSLVSLNNFKGGYCGLSRVENGNVNVCYLATYDSFKKYKNPDGYKENVLYTNPVLKSFFENAQPVFEKELTIAQVSFEKKSQVENHILMLGDAAGLIHPLCGNGMAMAIHSAKIASEVILDYYKMEKRSRKYIEASYKMKWDKLFKNRIITGNLLQKILLNPMLAEASQNMIRKMPFLLPEIIKRTHGKPVAA
ncbi:NAD(P)/FAD-dependent oxidoreductase [Autumnicola musiva]|uniref:NAD(P)/FAD-dependent oxidoreductase n=1 Tax=Autumnicola musiva TaxID=3075589 RepID=A0ABU3D765_9FLAO|nr:NAD(P)/FAD-dependent oxidoreductase [Zunongwangia sp. F117]MDT0677384.1 NAD(P)/FAD-dependent oxidoreductase [Zunongwangia sp. F117]